jgi:hypothetical protein
MHSRTLIGIAVTTLVLSLAVVGGLWQIDSANPAPGMQRSAAANSVHPLPERPVVPEPDDPVGTDAAVPAEPLARPELEPRRAPALDPVPGPGAERVTVAVLVLPAPSRVVEPEDPALAGGTDLAERIVVPALSRSELLPPSLSLASGDCHGAAWRDAL